MMSKRSDTSWGLGVQDDATRSLAGSTGRGQGAGGGVQDAGGRGQGAGGRGQGVGGRGQGQGAVLASHGLQCAHCNPNGAH